MPRINLKFYALVVLISGLWFSAGFRTVTAHSDSHPFRYVSNNGVDQGVCSQPKSPCRSIEYAVNQAGKGDRVKVAAGEYQLDGLDIFFLLSDMVIIEGGYNKDFSARGAERNESVIKGLPGEYRQRLASRGFKLLRDQKDAAIQLSIKDRQLLSRYQKLTSATEGAAECEDGLAGEYPCHNLDLQSHIPLSSFSSNPTSANDIWGFVDLNDQREYALIGLRNATAVVDVTNPQAPVEVGSVEGISSSWRDIKVYQYFDEAENRYQAYAYVTTEAATQGMQILDLTGLPDSVSLASTLTEFSRAHNVYLGNTDYANGMPLDQSGASLYIAGSNKDEGAFRVFSLQDPVNPSLQLSPPAGTGYVHDVTSLNIEDERKNDCPSLQSNSALTNCQLFIDFNESSVDLWDMTDKSNPTLISSTGYAGANYTHSGWWSEDKMTLLIQDELDERELGIKTTLRAMDISDLSNPSIIGTYTGQTYAIDHNGFSVGNYYYMSNYRRGLSVIDISTPSDMVDVAFFDTYPVPEENDANFDGAWGVYPYLPSGNILVSDIGYGLFVLKLNENDGEMPTEPNDDSGTGDSVIPPPAPASSGGGSINTFLLGMFLIIAVMRRKA